MDEAAEFARSVTNGQGADSAIVTVGVLKTEHVGPGVRGHPQGGHRRGHRHRQRRRRGAGAGVRADALPEAGPGRAVRRVEPAAGTSRGCCSCTRAASSSLDELITTTYKLWLERALTDGIRSAGGDVLLIGVEPTPAIAFTTVDLAHRPASSSALRTTRPRTTGSSSSGAAGSSCPIASRTRSRRRPMAGGDKVSGPARGAEPSEGASYLDDAVALRPRPGRRDARRRRLRDR